jgi:hypothetical protein
MSNNGPQFEIRKTGSKGQWAWACGYEVPGEYETRCPMVGKQYIAQRRVEHYGKTRLQAIKAFEAATGWNVN